MWRKETVPKQWREGLVVNLFMKGDREDPGNYRGITLLSVVGKVFCKILNRLVQCLDKEGVMHEGQAGFRVNRSCMYIFLITRYILPFTPMSHNFNHKPSRHTVSYAFCTSKRKEICSFILPKPALHNFI